METISENLGNLFVTQSIDISYSTFLINILLTALIAFILSRLYYKFSHSMGNRSQFAKTILLVAITTMLVISIVKSSLALSLGLVGALSIVRFRTAIKDPEELVYLFLSISIGLGFGANQGGDKQGHAIFANISGKPKIGVFAASQASSAGSAGPRRRGVWKYSPSSLTDFISRIAVSGTSGIGSTIRVWGGTPT